MIEGHGARPEGQSVGAEFRVTTVRTPILCMRKLVKQGHRFEAGPTDCKMSRGDRSVALDDVKSSLWVDVKVAPVVDGLPEELPSSPGPTRPIFETARAPRVSSAEYLDSSSQVDDMRKRLRELLAPVWGAKAHMWRRWTAQLAQPHQTPWRDPTHQQILNALLTKSRISHQRVVKLACWDVASKHVRRTPLERTEARRTGFRGEKGRAENGR